MEYIKVPERFIGKADFAMRVTGCSLEPIYFDGDLILARSTTNLKHGDLGIFKVDGRGCVRRYYCKGGEKKLVSLNVNVPELEYNSTVVCVGRVIGRAIGRI